MFSSNGKISEKQLRRMIVLSVFVSVIFVLPHLAARLLGESIVPGLLIFFGFSGIYVLYIYGMGEWYEKCRPDTEREGFISVLAQSGLVGLVLTLIQFLRLVIRLAFYILLAIAVLGEAQVPFMLKTNEELWSNVLVVLPLLLVGVYGAHTKLEKQGRIHEMLFGLLFIPFIGMLLFGIREVDYQVFRPVADKSWKELFLSGYMLLAFVLPMENYLYLRPNLQHRSGRNRTGIHVMAILVLAVILTLVMLGIYGVNGAADEPMTTIAIMRYIRLPFGILERFDVLMIWFFMVGCFILICQTLYYAGYISGRICGHTSSVWILLLVLFFALLVVYRVRTYENALLSFLCYGAVMDVPMSVILPLLGLGINRVYAAKKEGVTQAEKKETTI